MGDFTMFAGDTKILQVTVRDAASSVVDITGMLIRWQLAKTVKATEPLVAKAVGGGIVITDPTNGRFEVTIDPDDTLELSGHFYHEVEVNDAGTISTVLTGKATIKLALIKPPES